MRLSRRHFTFGIAAVGVPSWAVAAPDILPVAGDMTRPLQAAIDRASRERRPLQLGSGDYRVAGLILPEGADLIGFGQSTRLVITERGPGISAKGGASLRLRDLSLISDNASHGLRIEDVTGLVLDGITVSGAREACIAVERCGGRISNCRLERSAGSGLFAIDSRGLLITGNEVADCDNGGILVWRSRISEDGTQVLANRIARIRARGGGSGQNGNGINVYRADRVVIAQNTIADCAFSAIRVNSGSDTVITGNTCLRSGETALYVEFAVSGAVISANLVDTAVNGITVTNFNEGGRLASVTGNVVRNLSGRPVYATSSEGFGLGISVEADTAVTGNVIDGATIGIRIGYGAYLRDVVASANVIRSSPVSIGVSISAGAGTAIITGNALSGATAGAIVGFDGDRPATADLGVAGAERFRNLAISGNRISN